MVDKLQGRREEQESKNSNINVFFGHFVGTSILVVCLLALVCYLFCTGPRGHPQVGDGLGVQRTRMAHWLQMICPGGGC